MKKSVILFLLPLFTQCADQTQKDRGIPLDGYYSDDIPSRKDLTGVKIPVMQSFKFDKQWGKPEIKVFADGGYSLHYKNPESHWETLTILGKPGIIDSDAPEPPSYRDIGLDPKTKQPVGMDYTQKWETVTLVDRPVHYYTLNPGGGADALECSTVTFSLAKPEESVASYRLLATSNEPDSKKFIKSYFQTAGF